MSDVHCGLWDIVREVDDCVWRKEKTCTPVVTMRGGLFLTTFSSCCLKADQFVYSQSQVSISKVSQSHIPAW